MHEEIRKAKETLKRLEGIKDVFAADNARRDATFVPLRREPPAPLRSTATVTHETPQLNWEDDWNAWCESHVARGLERLADVIGQEVGEVERALIARIELLEQKVGEMHAERVVESAARDGEVLTIPNWRRKRNATA
jgi:hypothetical protein